MTKTTKPAGKKAPAKPKKRAAVAQSAESSPSKRGVPGSSPGGRSTDKPLPPKVLRFIDEYLVDLNGSAAYQRAGYKAKGNSAEVNARRLLRNAQVSLEIARRQSETAKKLEISREEALTEAWNIVKADANELIEYRRFACVSCFEDGHEEDRRDPNPKCSSCHGDGRANVIVKDTRKLSPQARALYAGVKITKEGIEVKMHSKLDALEKVFKHLGLYALDKKVELTGKAGGPIEVKTDLRTVSDAELEAIVAGALQR